DFRLPDPEAATAPRTERRQRERGTPGTAADDSQPLEGGRAPGFTSAHSPGSPGEWLSAPWTAAVALRPKGAPWAVAISALISPLARGFRSPGQLLAKFGDSLVDGFPQNRRG